jgi:hypothetical protein
VKENASSNVKKNASVSEKLKEKESGNESEKMITLGLAPAVIKAARNTSENVNESWNATETDCQQQHLRQDQQRPLPFLSQEAMALL